MVLFTILMITLLILTAILILMFGVGGFILAIVFGDVIVCIAIIVFIIKKIFFRKKE